ncbi:MAG: dihydroorotase [Candidatus Methylacidiphilales bacterium]
MKPLCLRGGRIIDPARHLDYCGDIWIEGDTILDGTPADAADAEVIPCQGLVIAPGLIDMHVHLREPGQSRKETIASGTRAAAAGGFTAVVAMPNTSPPADAVNTITWIRQRAAEVGVVRVYPTGCISQGMKGEVLAPIGSMKKAGIVAITDDGACIQSNDLMRRAMEYALMFGLPILDHCQDYSMTQGAVMNEGRWSAILGLKGWPAMAEEIIIARNALLSELTGAKVHCQHVTTAGGVRILREAKLRGVNISGEVCPHHLALTDEALQGYDTRFKMNPPLRTRRDVEALKEGLADGTLEYLASDHAPHCDFEKEVEFDDAPFGITGLETELGLFLTNLLHGGVLTLPQILERLTTNPARLLGLPGGTLAPGSPADITLIDPDVEWVFDREVSVSLSRNTPFHGVQLRGRAVRTIVGGRTVWSLENGFAH